MKPTEAKADAQEVRLRRHARHAPFQARCTDALLSCPQAAEGACDEEEEDEDDFMYNPEFDEAEARVAVRLCLFCRSSHLEAAKSMWHTSVSEACV